jgi:hypothetical protein
MGVKYVKDFAFPSAGGFHSGSVQRYAKGGHVTKLPAKAKDSAKGMPARAKPNAPARGAPKMESKPKVGKGQGYEKGGRVPGREMDRLPTKRPPGRGKDLAPARRFKGKYEGYAEGGPVAELDAGQPDYVAPKPRYQDLLEALPEAPVKREFVMPPEFDEEGFRVGPDRGGSRMYDPDRYISPEIPVGALTPLPEEPNYGPGANLDSHYRLNPPEEVSPPNIYDMRQRYRRDFDPMPVNRAEARRSAMQERAGMARDMMGRPGMRGVAPRSKGVFSKLANRVIENRMRAPAPVRQPAMLPFELQPEPLVPVFKKGGAVKGEKIAKVMREYKEGKLHSGSKKGPVVKNPKQAMAIALSEARAAKKAKGGEVFSDEYMAYESKGPKTRYTAAKGRRMAKERAMERRALDKARHAEKYAPGMSLDMSEYKKGGKVKHSDVKMDKAMVKKAVHKHEKAMHPGKKMTKLNKGGVPSYGRKPMYGGGKC